jgi:hypothetical protein
MRGDVVIRQAMSVGLHLSISLEGGVTIKGDPDIVRRWAPILRPHKAELIQRLPPQIEDWSVRNWRAFYVLKVEEACVHRSLGIKRAHEAAYEYCVVEWLNRLDCTTATNVCEGCGADSQSGLLIPYGVQPNSNYWLHPRCWPGWFQGRKRAAAWELEQMGIIRWAA